MRFIELMNVLKIQKEKRSKTLMRFLSVTYVKIAYLFHITHTHVHIIKVISSYFKVSEKICVMNCRRGVTAECNSERESAEQNETKEIDG